MKPELNQKQRVIVAIVYLILLGIIFNFLGGNFKEIVFGTSIDSSIWFYSGALLIILGAYIAEPFFTKPSDTIPNSAAIIISIIGLKEKSGLIGYNYIFLYAIIMLVLSIYAIATKENTNYLIKKTNRLSYWISTRFGHNKVIFSTLYIAAAISYFALEGKTIAFILIITLWICLIFFDLIGYIVSFITKIPAIISERISDELGNAIGCENPYLYKVEIDYSKHKRQKVEIGDLVAIETKLNFGSVGIIVSRSQLINKEWLSIYLLKTVGNDFIDISLNTKKQITDSKSIFTKQNVVYKLSIDNFSTDEKELIDSNALFHKRNMFIGYVEKDSNINTINFAILINYNKIDKEIIEGSIIEIPIYGDPTLYQIINGITKKEHLENFDSKGYTIGIARKLGKYNDTNNELLTKKWMPEIYSPIYLIDNIELSDAKLKEIAQNSIGRLPNSTFNIPLKDINSLVTHNTAILGILGIGKSCLAYELIKKISEEGIKTICIDITGEYINRYKGLPAYVNTDHISSGVEDINNDLDKEEIIVQDSMEGGGNVAKLRELLYNDILSFIESDLKIRVLNPDEIIAIQQRENARNRQRADRNWEMYAPFSELTIAEVTRVISEVSLDICKSLGLSEKAKLLLVYEEAHSLIPEWNSVANDSDKYATNGTSKVILQGRKYGLGCLIIAQRTANVSKNILNQCNTIFALRIFDDTGKAFLENYFGKDYSDILPTLEERWALTIGRGLKLKQPVIIQLNDKKYFVKKRLKRTKFVRIPKNPST